MTHADIVVREDEAPRFAAEDLLGRLTLLTGCMFSGKTTSLLHVARLFPEEVESLFKHADDTRYRPDAIVAHDGDFLPAHAIADPRAVTELIGPETHVVVIDEVQFFDEAIADVAEALVRHGIGVVAAGLNRGCWGQSFPSIDRMIDLAQGHHPLHARCAICAAPADRTQRTTPIVGGDLVGGAERYEPRCAACWTPPPSARLDPRSGSSPNRRL